MAAIHVNIRLMGPSPGYPRLESNFEIVLRIPDLRSKTGRGDGGTNTILLGFKVYVNHLRPPRFKIFAVKLAVSASPRSLASCTVNF